MASLQVVQGDTPIRFIELREDREFMIGRSEKCAIHVPHKSVSKEHAKVSFKDGGYIIADWDSTNYTYVNGRKLEAKLPYRLADKDEIKICNWLFRFHGSAEPTRIPIEDDEDEHSSTIHSALDREAQQKVLENQSRERLRTILKISAALTRMLDEREILEQIGQILLDVFGQADRCLILYPNESTDSLTLKTARTRRPDTNAIRFSSHIAKRVLGSGQSVLFDDAQRRECSAAESHSIAEAGLRSVMCAPLLDQDGNAFALIQVDTQGRTAAFSRDDLHMLFGVANQAAVALQNATRHSLAVRAAVFEQDLENARKVQRSFLPVTLPDVAGYEFFAFYEPARSVGGDYYDFIPYSARSMAVLVGDVMGKGMAAALFMAKLSALARNCLSQHSVIEAAIGALNGHVLAYGATGRFDTLSACVIDPLANRVTFVNAGHPSPLILRRASGILEVAVGSEKSGFPLGIEAAGYENVHVELNPGDCVIVYTDGITEASGPSGQTFRLDGLRHAIVGGTEAAAQPLTPQEIGKRITDAVYQHLAGMDQNDDMAIVCFGRLETALSVVRESGQTAAPRDVGSERTMPVFAV